MRWRVRFGYDGLGFRGWARQPTGRTIEGELLRGLLRAGIVAPGTSHLEVASRTDAGVSARANALAVPTRLGAGALLRALNGIAPDIFFTAAAPFAEEGRIRSALDRTYRYYEDPRGRDGAAYASAAALFEGRVDVRSLGRALPAGGPLWRPVDRVRLEVGADGWVVEVTAPSFVWGMMRKIVGACREVAAGRLSAARLRLALEGRTRLTLPMAEPGPLVLWEVRYAEPWTEFWRGPGRRQAQRLALTRATGRARAAVGAALDEGSGVARGR